MRMLTKLTKLFSVTIMLLVLIGYLTTTAFAAEKTQDGLTVTVTSDKEAYASTEDIKLSLAVTNTNDYVVSNISLAALLPQGLKLKDKQEAAVCTDSLAPGKSLTLELTAVAEETSPPTNPTPVPTKPSVLIEGETTTGITTATNNGANTTTGKADTPSGKAVSTGAAIAVLGGVLLAAGLSVVAIVLLRKRKASKALMSIILCAGIVLPMTAVTALPTKAGATDCDRFKVDHSITVAEKKYTISAIVNYDIVEDDNSNEKPSADNHIFAEMKTSGIYDSKLTYSLARPGECIENPIVSFLPEPIRDKVGEYMVVGDYIYYRPVFATSGEATTELRRMKVDGSQDELLADDFCVSRECKYYNNKLYYNYFSYTDDIICTSIDLISLEKKEENLPCPLDYYYNGLFYTLNGNKIIAFDLETGALQEVCEISGENNFLVGIDGNYLYYSEKSEYTSKVLYRVDLGSKKIEKLNSTFSEDLIVDNGIVYYFTIPENRMSGIVAYNIKNNTSQVLGEAYVAEGIKRIWFEDGVLFYTVNNGNNGNGSSTSYGASDYVFDLTSNNYILVSNYYIPQW